ncbi:MAG: hypothetical protein ACR2H0_05940 [Candidatus Limnocylindrales bacterium]
MASVTLITAGPLSYAPSSFPDPQTPEPVAGGDPRLSPLIPLNPTPTASARQTPTDGPRPTETPGLDATPSPALGPQAHASRIRIPSLHIDLPVVSDDLVVPGNVDLYPLCDVAMFSPLFVHPGQDGATYIYAHAQLGMFAPVLKASRANDGASMIGTLIELYTSDNLLHLYELYQVKRHATDLSLASPPPGTHMLVLQTSEGVSGTIPKLQVAARPLSVVPADRADANPTPVPRVCLPS